MKNVVRNMLLSVLISLSACLSLITCANPMSDVGGVIGNGGGLITVTIGGGSARATVTWANALDSSELTHEITVFGGEGGPHNGNIPSGGGTVSFSVIPGEWTISVKAYYKGDQVAEGEELVEIIKGDNGTIRITMFELSAPLRSYTVTFDCKGGKFHDGKETETQTVKKYNKATSIIPSKTDKGFAGWFSDSALTNSYNFHDPVTSDFYLYAGWSDDFFTVTFMDKGQTVGTQNITPGGHASVPNDVANIGHTGEWYKEPTFNTLWDFENNPITEDMPLYVKWTANAYHVVFHANGGHGTMPDLAFTYGTAQNLTRNAYERTGHIFEGWATSAVGTKVYDDEESVINLTEIADDTVNIYAVWTADNLVNAAKPTITKQPVAINEIYLSDTVELTVSATSSDGGNITFQWYSNTANNTNGTPIGNATSATYITPNTLAKGNHYYYCIVTNTNGMNSDTVTSHVAMVKVYGVGSGIEQDSFIVHNVTTLERVGKGEGDWEGDWSLSAHYKQIRDIELPNVPAGESNWTPIGTEFNPFTGSYDGNGKIIRNLKINDPSSEDSSGLFGDISETAVLENIGIVDCEISGNAWVGGVVGWNEGTVKNSYAIGKVSGAGIMVGGLVGGNGGTGTVEYCYATCNVSGKGEFGVGGLVGNNQGIVQYCYATGEVSGTGNFKSYVGGVVGHNIQDSGYICKVQNCVALNPNIIANTDDYGRIVGKNNSCIILNCYGRSDMKKNDETYSWQYMDDTNINGRNGEDIILTDWSDVNWWKETAEFDDKVWDFSGLDGTKLPKLKGMPGGIEAQNPVIKPLP
jgi:uncharacterized repeat protein (TIGR02543 family)